MAAISLGCAKNRVDTEEILGHLSGREYILTDHYPSADAIFINTCAFIEEAQQESITTILETVSSLGSKKPKIIAAGCLVEVFGKTLLKKIPELDGAIGVHSYRHLDQFMDKLFEGKRVLVKHRPPEQYQSIASRILTTPVHNANVKIAEGCNNRCHYCMIPAIRGPYRSRAPEAIKREVEELVAGGAKEINLIAQDTTAYGHDQTDWPDLTGLLKEILSIPGNFRIRIMYTYPSRINDGLIELIKEENRICKYLDIPIQHSSDDILIKMGRSYRRQDLEDLFRKLRRKIPNLVVRTTVMVGFPGEKRHHFKDLLNFIEKQNFENLGAFIYSSQEKTPAGGYDQKVNARIAKKRYKTLMMKQKKISRANNKKYLSQRLPVLVEGKISGNLNWYYGRTEYQAPEVDGLVFFPASKVLKPGSLVSAVITAAGPYNLLALHTVPVDWMPR